MTDERAAGSVRRVAVSGAGAVSGLGWGVEPLWEGLRSGRTAIRPFHRFDHSQHRTHLAAEVPAPASSAPGRLHRLSIADRFAVFAAVEALGNAKLEVPLEDLEAGVWFGSSTGG